MPNNRREYGEGSIRQITRKGRTFWMVEASGGVDPFGKRVRLSRTANSEKDAKRVLSELEAKIREGDTGERKKTQSLGDYLETWLKRQETNGAIRASTLRAYGITLRVHVIPIAGRVPLLKFDAERALLLYDELAKKGASASTRKKAHAVLSVALGDAVPTPLKFNPLATISKRKKPTYVPAERKPYSAAEIRTFLAAVAGDRYEALYVLALFSQLREGEIFALERGDVHFGRLDVDDDPSFVQVVKSKTDAGLRRADLPAIAALALAAHLSPASLLRRKASASPLVFPGARGKPLLPRNFLRRELYPAMERAKLRRITFHDFRHSGAMLIAHRVPITVLRERLGHTSESTTLLYAGHRSPGNQGAAVAAFDAIVTEWRTNGERGEKSDASRG